MPSRISILQVSVVLRRISRRPISHPSGRKPPNSTVKPPLVLKPKVRSHRRDPVAANSPSARPAPPLPPELRSQTRTCPLGPAATSLRFHSQKISRPSHPQSDHSAHVP